jgi:hypothetical protein
MIYDAIWKPAGVYKKLSGFVTAIDFIRAAVEVQSDERFEDVRYIVKDLSEVTAHTLTTDAMTDLAVIHCGFRSVNPNCRIVFVCFDENLANVIKNTLTSQKLASILLKLSEVFQKPMIGLAANLIYKMQDELGGW